MTNILDEIVANKRREIELRKGERTAAQIEQKLDLTKKCRSLRGQLEGNPLPRIIAEIKRRSPSKGILNDKFRLPELARGYESAGAAALSVLTDFDYFSGTLNDLREARAAVSIPVLRKDFMIDEYQMLEAREAGADVVLIIAKILTRRRASELIRFAKDLALEVLLEVHNEEELAEYLNPEVDLVGVNNRNLDTLEIDMGNSIKLAPLIPQQFVKISESGVSSIEAIVELSAAGYSGFLIGHTFMTKAAPEIACAELVAEIESRWRGL